MISQLFKVNNRQIYAIQVQLIVLKTRINIYWNYQIAQNLHFIYQDNSLISILNFHGVK